MFSSSSKFTAAIIGFSAAFALIPTSIAIPAKHSNPAVTDISTPATVSTQTTTQAATNLCGDEDYIILDSTPWIVYNMLYNADEIVGSQCTGYQKTETVNSTLEMVAWNSTTSIEYVEAT